MSVDIHGFGYAGDVFLRHFYASMQQGKNLVKAENDVAPNSGIAGTAIKLLQSFDAETMKKLTKIGVVHPELSDPRILETAESALENYRLGSQFLARDQYRALAMACHAINRLYDNQVSLSAAYERN